MHHAPSNARLQTHVHVTNRMPQLHQRDCMAHPKKPKTSNNGEIFFSWTTAVSVRTEGESVVKPSVALCVRSERWGSCYAAARRRQRGAECALVLGRRAARREAEWSSVSPITDPPQVNPTAAELISPIIDYPSLVTSVDRKSITYRSY